MPSIRPKIVDRKYEFNLTEKQFQKLENVGGRKFSSLLRSKIQSAIDLYFVELTYEEVGKDELPFNKKDLNRKLDSIIHTADKLNRSLFSKDNPINEIILRDIENQLRYIDYSTKNSINNINQLIEELLISVARVKQSYERLYSKKGRPFKRPLNFLIFNLLECYFLAEIIPGKHKLYSKNPDKTAFAEFLIELTSLNVKLQRDCHTEVQLRELALKKICPEWEKSNKLPN